MEQKIVFLGIGILIGIVIGATIFYGLVHFRVVGLNVFGTGPQFRNGLMRAGQGFDGNFNFDRNGFNGQYGRGMPGINAPTQ
jgi:hypothetical protein